MRYILQLVINFFSFVQEFVGDPFDGVTLLLDLLRAIQLSQANNSHYTPGSSATTGKIPPSVQRRALLDELTCLQCLFCSCIRYSEAVRKLTASSAGLFTLAVCIMSNVNKSRIIALQVLIIIKFNCVQFNRFRFSYSQKLVSVLVMVIRQYPKRYLH